MPPGRQTHPSNTSLIFAGTDDDLGSLPVGQLVRPLATSVQELLGTTPLRVDDVNKNPVTVHTRASLRSGPALPSPGSSASRSTTAATRTSSARSRRASSTRGDQACRARWDERRRPTRPDDCQRRTQSRLASCPTPSRPPRSPPTILALLGLNPDQLTAVQDEGTQVLPGLVGTARRALTRAQMRCMPASCWRMQPMSAYSTFRPCR